MKLTNFQPSSSASVESEIRKIKRGVLHGKGKFNRVDVTVEELLDYYDGRMRIFSETEQKHHNDSETSENVSTSSIQDAVDNFSLTECENADGSKLSTCSDACNDTSLADISVNRSLTPTKNSNLENACSCGSKILMFYSCKMCQRIIHLTDDCSVLSSTEGLETVTSSWRVCFSCNESKDINYQIALNEMENHHGLALKESEKSEKKRKSLYLGDSSSKISDVIDFSSDRSKVPILKNGFSMKLEFVVIAKKNLYFSNTCPFDSISQVLFTTARDHRWVYNLFQKLKKEFFFFNSNPR